MCDCKTCPQVFDPKYCFSNVHLFISGLKEKSTNEMRVRFSRTFLFCSGLVVAVAASLYCVMGMVQLASFSAGPNYPHELAMHHLRQWLLAMGLSIFIAILCAILLRKACTKKS